MISKLYLYIVAFLFFIGISLIGCTPNKNVIPALQYRDQINIHIPKKACIYWVPGKQVAHELSTASENVSDLGGNGLARLIGDLIVISIQSQHRKNNPSQYILEYGKADEVVVITSLRDILERQNVFKSIELITDPSEVNARDVLIRIYFKTARVSRDRIVKLSVNLSIKTGNRSPYERTYLIQSDEETGGIFKSKTFLEKKTEASQELLASIINGIKQWDEGK